MSCHWSWSSRMQTSRRRAVSSGILANPAAITVTILLMCCSVLSQFQSVTADSTSTTPRVPRVHRVEWTPEGVRNYSISSPLVVELRDTVVLECDHEGNYAYSNLVIQHDESQFNKCNCMTTVRSSCEVSLRTGYCARELPADITLEIIHRPKELSSVVNFFPGRLYFFVSYSSSQDLRGSQSDLFEGGDCSRGLKMAVMVAQSATQPPPTTTPTSKSVDISTDVTDDSATSNKDTSTKTTGNKDKDVTDDNSKDNSVDSGKQVAQSELVPAQKLKDWHISVIAILAGLLILSVVIFAIVIAFVCYRNSSAIVAPSDDSGELQVNSQKIYDDKVVEGSVIRNKGMEANQTNTAYPEGLFQDPLDT